jgi:hypothetical protein
MEIDAEKLNELIRINIEQILPEYLKRNGVVQRKPAKVVTVGTGTATVYFPTDLSNESIPYKNKSGETVVNGDAVYIENVFQETDQGYIAYKK